MKAWCFVPSLVLLVLFASACPEDDCTPSLEEWCGEGGCQAQPDLDEALAQLLTSNGILDTSQRCGDRVIVQFSGGFTSTSLVYDAMTGKLVGGASGSDELTNDECKNQMAAAGESPVCDGDACSLWVSGYTSGTAADACQGALAEPLVAACRAEPPNGIVGCEECACSSCYSTLLAARGDVGGIGPPGVGCLKDHCPDECSAQIDMLE